MSNFRFSGRHKSDGSLISGELLAPSGDALAEQLLTRGIIPLKIELIPEDVALNWFRIWMRENRPPKTDDMILFARQMQTLLRAGVPITRAIQGVRDGLHNYMLRNILTRMVDGLEAGQDLSATMASHPKVFDNLFVNMIRIGEQTGRLDEAFGQLFRYLEVDRITTRQIKSAVRYPSIVLGVMAIAMFVIIYFVIPVFFDFYDKMKLTLPWQTQLLIDISKFTLKYWYVVLLTVFGTAGSFVYYIRTEQGDLWWSGYKLTLPLIGSIIKRGTLSRFARAYSMSSRSGVALMEALDAVSKAVDNTFVGSKIQDIKRSIERGETMNQAAYNTKMFTPLVLQMMMVGEETGMMDQMMEDVANFYEQELEYDVKALSSAIEPLLTLMLAGMVLILALGIFLPMWDLVQMAKQH